MGSYGRRRGRTFWGTVEEKRAEKAARHAAKLNAQGSQLENKATPQPSQKNPEPLPTEKQPSRFLPCCIGLKKL